MTPRAITGEIVPMSGGKDSTALAFRLRELNPTTDYTYVCTPTGDELPEWFVHMRQLADRLGSPIIPIMHRVGLNGLVAEQNAIPNWRQRWCTRMIKIEPFQAWLVGQSPCVVHVGIRADEPEREGGDYRGVPGVEMRMDLREWDWGLAEVLSFLEQRDIVIPERTDCARCFYQTLGEWWVLWREHADIYADAEAQEASVGHTWRSPGRDSWPAALKDLRAKFEAGLIPPRTSRQHDLFRNTQCRVCRA
jgi:3'-phosphoadenosine 5'-phosphosulfate sulfotransferase (PAPS reductase)/FAD synthetase